VSEGRAHRAIFVCTGQRPANGSSIGTVPEVGKHLLGLDELVRLRFVSRHGSPALRVKRSRILPSSLAARRELRYQAEHQHTAIHLGHRTTAVPADVMRGLMAEEKPPLKLLVEPGEYRCVWLLPGPDGVAREYAGALDLQPGRPPIGSVSGDIPIRWAETSAGECNAGSPQEFRVLQGANVDEISRDMHKAEDVDSDAGPLSLQQHAVRRSAHDGPPIAGLGGIFQVR